MDTFIPLLEWVWKSSSTQWVEVQAVKDRYHTLQTEVEELNKHQSQVVLLDVGGVPFHTTTPTFTANPSCDDSMLQYLFSGHWPDESDPHNHNHTFLDRDGKLFTHILTYLRLPPTPHSTSNPSPHTTLHSVLTPLSPLTRWALTHEARYFGLDLLQKFLQSPPPRSSSTVWLRASNMNHFSLDGGNTWKLSMGTIGYNEKIVQSGRSLVTVHCASGTVYRSIDWGMNWVSTEHRVSSHATSPLAVTSSGVAAMVAQGGHKVLVSRDEGNTWIPTLCSDCDICGVYACGSTLVANALRKLVVSTDNGHSWKSHQTPTPFALNCAVAILPNFLALYSYSYLVLYSNTPVPNSMVVYNNPYAYDFPYTFTGTHLCGWNKHTKKIGIYLHENSVWIHSTLPDYACHKKATATVFNGNVFIMAPLAADHQLWHGELDEVHSTITWATAPLPLPRDPPLPSGGNPLQATHTGLLYTTCNAVYHSTTLGNTWIRVWSGGDILVPPYTM